MMSIKSSRVGMPMAWAAVALLCQFGVLGCSTLFARDSEVSRSLLFGLAELIGIGGVVCGLIGYTLLARVRPSSMGPVIFVHIGRGFRRRDDRDISCEFDSFANAILAFSHGPTICRRSGGSVVFSREPHRRLT